MWGSIERLTNKDCEFLFGTSISNDEVASFQTFDRSDLGQSGTALEVAVIIKLHGMEQKWSVLLRQLKQLQASMSPLIL